MKRLFFFTTFLHLTLIAQTEDLQIKEEIKVVFKQEDFRYRSNEAESVLIYKRDFFDRFNPQSLGEILNRIPGISGDADAGEFHKIRLRGVDPAYTQVLINGRPMASGENDRSPFVDQIPANMVERIEIHRGPSADLPSNGVAGTVNIVLRSDTNHEARTFELGTTYFEEPGQWKSRGSLSFNHENFFVNAGFQERHNPKTQQTKIFIEDEPEQFKDEINQLSAEDINLSAGFFTVLSNGTVLKMDGFFTNLEQDEFEEASFFEEGEFSEGEFDYGSTSRDHWGVGGHLEHPFSNGWYLKTGAQMGKSKRNDVLDMGTFEFFERDNSEREVDKTQNDKEHLYVNGSIEWNEILWNCGLVYDLDKYHARRQTWELEEGQWEALYGAGLFDVREQTSAAFVTADWKMTSTLNLKLGLRYQEWSQRFEQLVADQTEKDWFPSLHLLARTSETNRWRLSLGRSMRKPEFDQILPFSVNDQPWDDQFTMGNPSLLPEYASNIDFGFEHQLSGGLGLFGINLFYRDLSDKIEFRPFGENGFRPENIGNAVFLGIEFDAGSPLHKLNLPNTSFFLNFTVQDSSFRDPETDQKRAFNLQNAFVGNMSVLHVWPNQAVSIGVNLMVQGNATEYYFHERADVRYGEDLQVLLEKKIGPQWALKLTARNLLDADRSETLRIYDGLWSAGELEETWRETERNTPSFRLTLKGSF